MTFPLLVTLRVALSLCCLTTLAVAQPVVPPTVRDSLIVRLLEDLGDEDAKVRWGAVEQLQSAYESGVSIAPARSSEVATALAKRLGDADAVVRRGADTALQAMGPAAASVVPALVECLQTEDYWAFAIVCSILDAAWEITPVDALASASEDADPFVRRYMVHRAIVQGRGDAVVPVLLKIFRDEGRQAQVEHSDPRAGFASRLFVEYLSRNQDGACARFVGCLSAKDAVLRGQAARVLGETADPLWGVVRAPLAVPALENLLDDNNKWVRKAAEEALVKIRASYRAAPAN